MKCSKPVVLLSALFVLPWGCRSTSEGGMPSDRPMSTGNAAETETRSGTTGYSGSTTETKTRTTTTTRGSSTGTPENVTSPRTMVDDAASSTQNATEAATESATGATGTQMREDATSEVRRDEAASTTGTTTQDSDAAGNQCLVVGDKANRVYYTKANRLFSRMFDASRESNALHECFPSESAASAAGYRVAD